MRSALAPTLVGALVLACTESSPAKVEVHHAYARASAPGAPNGAVFMTLVNSGGPGQVVGVRSPVSEVAELHTHLEEDGMMRMRQIEEVELPGPGEVRFEPGGLHVMLIRLNGPLEVGDRVPITLELAGGQRLEFEAPVRGPSPRPSGDQPGSRPASAPASPPSSPPPTTQPSSAPAAAESAPASLPPGDPASAPAPRGHRVAPDR